MLLPEAAAVKQYSAGCFYLPGASLPTWDKLHYFMKFYEGIKKRVNSTAKPFIYDVKSNGRFTQKTIP
jgi:hypothetical protein